MANQSRAVRVGVFVPGDSQVLDLACVDLLAMMGKQYLSVIPMLPRATVDAAPTVEIAYITCPQNMPNIPMTAGATLRATHDTSHPDVQPGKLDVVLVPGPDPSAEWGADALAFLAAHAREPGTDILSVCTGIFLCGAAGLLEGKRVCGPRGMQDMLRKRFTTTTFEGEKFRWLQDGNLWTSGGITNGNDLVAAYARASKHFPTAIADLACKMADVGDRPQLYDQGQAGFTIGFVWTLLRVWFSPKRD